MDLELTSFPDAGNLNNERVVIRARADLDIGNFVILRSKKNSKGEPTSGIKDAYWLPDRTIKKGDLIVLYTKSGKSSKKMLESGHTAHFYYWGKERSFWAEHDNNTVVIVETKTWMSGSPFPSTDEEEES